MHHTGVPSMASQGGAISSPLVSSMLARGVSPLRTALCGALHCRLRRISRIIPLKATRTKRPRRCRFCAQASRRGLKWKGKVHEKYATILHPFADTWTGDRGAFGFVDYKVVSYSPHEWYFVAEFGITGIHSGGGEPTLAFGTSCALKDVGSSWLQVVRLIRCHQLVPYYLVPKDKSSCKNCILHLS
ncbi:unnamed protein product [Closterium sp. Yama58-4]|nr:unnamed protein product [Closterium sp. Yama58-4]